MDSKPFLPPDDPLRRLTVADPEDVGLAQIGLAGDTYTVLISGAQTAGRYCLIDMHVPPGGGPPLHRHDFEEFFHVLAGEIEVTFRGKTLVLKVGQTANIPANAPHRFVNAADQPARLLCMCAPAGQEEFFLAIGDCVEGRTTPAPKITESEMAERMRKAEELAPKFRTEFVKPE